MSSTVNLQDVINDVHLRILELEFHKIQGDRSGITFEQFQNLIFDVIDDYISEKELQIIFVRVDTNSSGLIDWSGFITYMHNELELRDQVSTSINAALKSTFHIIKPETQDTLCKIGLMPFVSTNGKIVQYVNGRYVTITKDGYITIWTQAWQIQKTRQCVVSAVEHRRCPWMLDMVCVCNMSIIAVAAADETIKFYDCLGSKIEYVSVLEHTGAIITCLDYSYDEGDPSEGFLTFGDSLGNVTILHFLDCLENKMFGTYAGRRDCQRVSLRDIIHGRNVHCSVLRFTSVYGDWVKQVRYLPRLKAVLSCSLQSTTSMILQGINFEVSKRIYKVSRGITCFDFDDDLNLIVTGSIDRCVRVWNPFITGKSIASFYGHSTPVTHVLIIREVEQVVTVSVDKCLRVWDLKDQTCIQQITTTSINWGPYPITAAFHNKYRRQIVLATTKIVAIERVWEGIGNDNTVFVTHHAPITGIIYSDYYNQLVSACRDGALTFWDLETGRRNVHIPLAHCISQDSIQISSEISAISLDETKKKLITAGRDFIIRVWNLSNGASVTMLKVPQKQEITAIVCAKQRVFFAGWSRRVYMCNDNFDADSVKAWPVRHFDDILDMSYLSPNLIVTSSWDGRIRLWLLESGTLKSTLTIHQHFAKRNYPFPASGLVTGMSVDSLSLESQQTTVPPTTYQESISETGKSSSLSTASTLKSSGIGRKDSKPSSLPSKKGKTTTSPATKLHHLGKFKRASFGYQKDSFPAVTCLQCLTTRDIKPAVGNLFLADITGMIQVWSTHASGGPLAIFASTSLPEQYITCMTTDNHNKFLVTGDSYGYIRIWYIHHYHSEDFRQHDDLKPNSDTENFPFMKTALSAAAAKARWVLSQFRPKQFAAFLNTEPPVLLSCYRGHLTTVVQILLIEEKQLLLSASTDQSVRIWTMEGRYLVTFGDNRGWNLTKMLTMFIKPTDRKAPSDIRRVGSAVTLQVLMAGLGPRWWKLRKLFLYIYVKAIMRKSKENKLKDITQDVVPAEQSSTEESQEVSITDTVDDRILNNVEVSGRAQPPIGKYFSFRPRTTKPPSLLNIRKSKKFEINAMHSYIPDYPLESMTLDEFLSSVSPSLAAKLKNIKRTAKPTPA